MELRVISPQTTQAFSIVWLEVYTPVGNFVIQPGHAPMVLALSPDQSITFRLTTGKQETMTVRQGVIEVARDAVTVLINEAA